MRDLILRGAVVLVLGLVGISGILGACRGPWSPSERTPGDVTPGDATKRAAGFEIELVSLDTGAPIAGAELAIESSAATREEMLDRALVLARERAAASRVTDERGLVRFDAPPRAPFSMVCRLASEPFGYSWHAFDSSLPEGASAATPSMPRRLRIEVPTEPDLAVRGRVVERLGGAPIAGARVRLFDDRARFETPGGPAERFFGRGTTTDQQGRFELSVCSRAGARLAIDAPGFGPAVAWIREPTAPLQGGVAVSNDSLAVDVELDRSPSERLQVVDAQGRPAAGVALRARNLISRAARWLDNEQRVQVQPDYDYVVTTDARGECELPLSQDWNELTLSRDGMLLARLPVTPASREDPRRIVLADPPPIRGVARSPDGRPESGVELWLVDGRTATDGHIDNPHRPLAKAITDEEGRFEFRCPCPGDWLVAPAYSRVASLEPDPTAPAPWGERVHVEARLPGPSIELVVWRGLYLTGRVRDDAGNAVRGVHVLASGLSGAVTSTVSFEDGSFVLGPLPGGRWTLWNEASPDWVGASPVPRRHLVPGTTVDDVDLRVSRAARIDLRVLDAAGTPAGDVQVTLRTRADFGEARPVLHSADPWQFSARSTAALDRLGAGTYDLLVRRPSASTTAAARVELRGGEARSLELTLAPAATLRLYNDRAEPAELEYRVNGGLIEFVALPPGAWVNPKLPAGTCELRVLDARGKELARESIELTAGAAKDYRIR